MGLLVYSIVLSIMILSSCYLIDAMTSDNDAHSVGLKSFENELGICVPHNAYVIEHYNGKEMTAKVGGYVAPCLASLAALFLVFEFCHLDGCFATKCIPGVLVLGATVCQGLTFLLFQSKVFCNNKAISKCELGNAGYHNIQAILMYAGCLVLYTFGPNPQPFSSGKTKTSPSSEGTKPLKSSISSSSSLSSSKKKKKKKKKKRTSGPGKGEDYTKEMYEQRRKEKKVKSRGVSGRSKEEIYHERTGSRSRSRSKSRSRDEKYENSITLYDPKMDQKQQQQRRSRSQPKYDDYVDTEPDGMDWSAFTPNQRDEYYERKRSRKRREGGRKQSESEREKLREWARELDERNHDRSRSPKRRSSYGDDYSRGDEDSYGGSYYDDDSRRDDKMHRSDRRGSYDVERMADDYIDDDGGDSRDYSEYRSQSGRDSRYSQSQIDDGDSRYYDSRTYNDRDSRYDDSRGHEDDYTDAQDEYTYADDYDDGPPDGDDSYYYSRQSSYSSSRRSRSGGRSRRDDRRSYNVPV